MIDWERMMLNGTTRRGKYTLLKICALLIKVYWTELKQSEKKAQIIVPAKKNKTGGAPSVDIFAIFPKTITYTMVVSKGCKKFQKGPMIVCL